MNKIRAYDLLGNIAVVKFPRGAMNKDKKKFAEKLMRGNKAIKTILEKSGKIKGRLRKLRTKFMAGEKTKEALYKENNCVFRFNVDKVYFSPRLSNERKEIASKIKKSDSVLVMFAGVAPYSIVIAKKTGALVYSNEINKEANKYAELNIRLNKLKGKVVLLPGDIKKVAERLSHYQPTKNLRSPKSHDINVEVNEKQNRSYINSFTNYRAQRDKLSNIPRYFDVIVMPRPQLKDTFLKEAFKLSGKGTRIFYYDFCKIGEEKDIVEKIKNGAKKAKKKIKILKIKHAGEIAPYKIRVRVDLAVV